LADISFEEVGKILRALERLDCDNIYLEFGDLKLEVSRGAEAPRAAAAPVTAMAPPPTPESQAVPDAVPRTEVTAAATSPPADDVQQHWICVAAPMVGTFYRAPGPGEDPFVEVGDVVRPGQTVGVLEVMKLFTEVKSEVEGKVTRIDAEDAVLVESGRALVWIEPS
jgi:acetyl-CoA carboxylase biotin carboxyl carrier protein